jgi:IS605 OrfB family transposase
MSNRCRAAVIELRPTKEQTQACETAARIRRRARNFLVFAARQRLAVAIWRSCVTHAARTGQDPRDVRRAWAKPEERGSLKAAGFKLEKPSALTYKDVTEWADVRRRRWMLGQDVCGSEPRKEATNNFRKANDNRIASLIGRRAGRVVGPPQPQSRFAKPSWTYQIPAGSWVKKITSTHITIPVIGPVRVKENPLKHLHGGEVKLVTIKREGRRWYAVLRVSNMGDMQRPHGRKAESIGVDLNVGDNGIVLSTGERYPVPERLEELDQKIRKHQRLNRNKVKPGRGKRPSVRWVKQNRQLQELHREMVRVRRDWLNRVSSELVRRYEVIVVEDLNVAGMTASAKGTVDAPGVNVRAKASLNRRVLQASFATFRQMLDYKLGQTGGTLAVVDRWFPSSKLCSRCGWRFDTQTLNDRVFRCPTCGLVENRDRNAARNLRRVYEDSKAAAAAGSTGGGRRSWTGGPLRVGHVLTIKSPGKTAVGGRKRERTKGARGRSGHHGGPEDARKLVASSEAEVTSPGLPGCGASANT